ncbi:MAG: PEP-CTERM sorting domain-containing protein [Opitutaceae bacterium]|jgi:hypothetical protein|nr:PEP-CTERM sorting domain-containing protein [Opitutaceae bacterium]
MKKSLHARRFLAAIVTLFATAATATVEAADIKQIAPASSNDLNWETASLWDNEAAASTGNHYFTNGYTLRTPTPGGGTGTTTFPGASLTVEGGDGGTRGALTLKAKTTIIGNLLIGVGSVANNVNTGTNQPATLVVTNLTILSTATNENAAILQGANTNQNITLNVTNLLGNGYLRFTNPRSYVLSVANAAAFTGEINLNQGTLTLATDFAATGATFSMASSGASLVLTGNLSVSSFTFGTTTLSGASQSYTSSELNALFSTTAFSGGGNVSIAPVPEPSTLGLLFGGVALAACYRAGKLRQLRKAGGGGGR